MAALAYRPSPDRRSAALALTVLAHALLLFAWQATRRLPPRESGQDVGRIQWIILPPRTPALPRPAPPQHLPAPERAPVRTHLPAPARLPMPMPGAAPAAAAAAAAAPAPAATIFPATPAAPGPAASPTAGLKPAPGPDGPSLVERARREAGAIDRDLRKENRAYIVAPPDSPAIRMRQDMEEAHAMAPNKWYEAPKIDELVNNTGDGARRTRVRTGFGTYCITERSPASSIDTIETLGKTRLTSCPKHETPAKAQEWKTARDP